MDTLTATRNNERNQLIMVFANGNQRPSFLGPLGRAKQNNTGPFGLKNYRWWIMKSM